MPRITIWPEADPELPGVVELVVVCWPCVAVELEELEMLDFVWPRVDWLRVLPGGALEWPVVPGFEAEPAVPLAGLPALEPVLVAGG
jgi:hypothetical protein